MCDIVVVVVIITGIRLLLLLPLLLLGCFFFVENNPIKNCARQVKRRIFSKKETKQTKENEVTNKESYKKSKRKWLMIETEKTG